MHPREAKELAYDRLKDFPELSDWTIKISSNSKTLGRCFYSKKLIKLSKRYIIGAQVSEFYETLNHEIAHALTPGNKHNIVWQSKAAELGCKVLSPYSKQRIPQVLLPFYSKCPKCNTPYFKSSRPRNGRTSYCPICYKQSYYQFDVSFALKWIDNRPKIAKAESVARKVAEITGESFDELLQKMLLKGI